LALILVVALIVAAVAYAGFTQIPVPASQSTGEGTTSTGQTSTFSASNLTGTTSATYSTSTTAPSTSSFSSITSSTTTVQNLGALVGGPGESWTLSFYNYTEPSKLSSLTAAWNNYFSQPDFQANKAMFHWNLIRLSFCFSDICGSQPYSVDVHSANGTTPDLSWLDAVIGICNHNGLEVMLSESTYTGSAPDTAVGASTFIADWGLLAQHENGNPGIAIYQIANEIEDNSFINSTYGSLPRFLSQITGAIRTYEPNRAVAWWNYAGFTNSPGDFGGEAASNMYVDFHVETYNLAGGQFSSCKTASDMNSYLTQTLGSSTKTPTGIPSINGEIDAQFSQCNSVTENYLGLLIGAGIPYVIQGYSVNRANWDAILAQVTPPTPT
jgi:hypothetical protein